MAKLIPVDLEISGFMKVLVVHWQESVANQIKEHLPQCRVTCVNDGLNGLAAIRSSAYDLIISSYILPGITGFEMIRALRLLSLNREAPVIIVAEGNETFEHHKLAKKLEAAMLSVEEVKKLRNLDLWLN
jgi:CheY-like chemotaxis protein